MQFLSVFPPYSWTFSTACSQTHNRKSRVVRCVIVLVLFRQMFGIFGRRTRQSCGLYHQFRSFFWVLHPVSNRDILTVDGLLVFHTGGRTSGQGASYCTDIILRSYCVYTTGKFPRFEWNSNNRALVSRGTRPRGHRSQLKNWGRPIEIECKCFTLLVNKPGSDVHKVPTDHAARGSILKLVMNFLA